MSRRPRSGKYRVAPFLFHRERNDNRAIGSDGSNRDTLDASLNDHVAAIGSFATFLPEN